MSRKLLQSETDIKKGIESLIIAYADTRNKANQFKKESDKQNAEIKDYMRKNKLDEKDAGDYTATFSVENRDTLNKDMLLDILKNCGEKLPDGIIKTKEYVDTDALESAIYNGVLSKETVLSLDKARDNKPVEVLRIKRRK